MITNLQSPTAMAGFYSFDLGSKPSGTVFTPNLIAGLQWWPQSDKDLMSASAAHFAAATPVDYLSVANNASLQLGNSSWTWILWLYFDDSAGTYIPISKVDAGQREMYLTFNGSNNRLEFYVSDTGSAWTGSCSTANSSFLPNTWHMVTLQYNISTGAFSVSMDAALPAGINIGTPTLAIRNGTAPLRFGHNPESGQKNKGRMDGAFFWNRQLSPSEITAVYNSGNGYTWPTLTTALKVGLVSAYDFDGSLTVDSQGTNTLTNNNGVTFEAGIITVKASINGQVVGKIIDTSAIHRDATAPAIANYASFTTPGQNGLPTLTFDGVNDLYNFSAITLTDFSIFFVQKCTGDSIILSKASGSNAQFRIGKSGNNALTFHDGTTELTSGTLLTPKGLWSVVGIVRSGTTVTFYENGVAKGTGTAGASITLDQLGVLNGAIGEGTVYDSAINAGNIAVLNTSLRTKWGIENILLYDSFTGTSGNNLLTHTMDIGGGWIINTGSWTISTNKAADSVSASRNYATGDAGVVDFTTSVSVTWGTMVNDAGIIIRAINELNLWSIRANATLLRIVEVNANVETVRASGAISISPSSTHKIRATCKNNQISAYFDDVLICSYNSAFLNDKTRTGISSLATVSGELHTFDNFLCTGNLVQGGLTGPTGLTAVPHASTISLTWNAVTGALSYKVLRSTVSGIETTYATGIGTNSYTDTNVVVGQNYYYKVIAVDASGDSPLSTEVGAAVTPDTQLDAITGYLINFKPEAQSGVGDGNDITTVIDSSGNSNNTTSLVTGNRPARYIAAGINSKPSFNFIDPQSYECPAIFPSGSHTVGGVCQASVSNQTCIFGSSTSNTDHSFRISAATQLRYRYTGTYVFNFTVPTITETTDVISLLHTHDSALGLMNGYLNGDWIGQAALPTGGISAACRFYGNTGTSNGTYYLSNAVLKASVFTPKELQTYFQGSRAKWNYKAVSRQLITFDGASYFADGGYYQSVLEYLSGETSSGDGHQFTALDWKLIAVSGQTLVQRLAAQITDLFPFYTGRAPKNCVVFWGGGNDISSGMDATTFLANQANYYKFARNVGFGVILFSIIDRTFATPSQAAGDATRATINAEFVAHPSLYCDLLIDLAANAHFGPAGARNDGAYYQGDATHLVTGGYDLVKVLANPPIKVFWDNMQNWSLV